MIRRLFPQSLLGQVMLVLAFGLLVGQAVSGVLLYRAAEQRRDAVIVNQLALQLVNGRERAEERIAMNAAMRARREFADAGRSSEHHMASRRRMRMRLHGFEQRQTSPLLPGESRIPKYEQSLAEVLEEQGLNPRSIVVTIRWAKDDPLISARPRMQQALRRGDWREREIVVAGIERADGLGWDVLRHPMPERPRGVIGTIIFQTLVIFAFLFALLFLVLRRITRPLAELTTRLADFSHQPDRTVQLEERGPDDMRRLIAAHNAMETRISALIDEKDVMLGAIGHDLKTPLAALRVRIESVDDETQRARMAQSIEDITRTLDDILELARIGRPSETIQATDLAALVAGLVEEYEDLGKPVSLADSPRIALPVRASLLRRAIRNLIDNALRYGKRAGVSLARDGGMAVLSIEDDGPGIPAQQIAAMLEPFQRGEASRNRATGGAGLGLTLARAIVLQHGGELTLANRPEGGLRAEIRIPLG